MTKDINSKTINANNNRDDKSPDGKGASHPMSLVRLSTSGDLFICPVCKKKFIPKFKDYRNAKKRYCSKKCRIEAFVGCFHGGNLKKGYHKKSKFFVGQIVKYKDSTGSLRNYVYMPTHPGNNYNHPFTLNARWVFEKHLRRFLKAHEIVHHMNDNKEDDFIGNLRMFESKEDHYKIHNREHVPLYRAGNEETIIMINEIFGVEMQPLLNLN